MKPPPEEVPEPAEPAPHIPPPPGMTNAPSAEENPHDVWLSVRAASAFLGVGPRRLHQLRKNGQLAARKRGLLGYTFRENDLMAFVESAASAPVPPESAPASAPATNAAPAASQSMADIKAAFAQMGAARAPEPDDPVYAEQAPITRMANAILVVGVDSCASDVHFEPALRNMRVRTRVNGTLREVMNIPKHIQAPLTQRLLVMADLDPFGKGLQRGIIWIKHAGRDYNVRVLAAPTPFGLSQVLRIFDQKMVTGGMAALGMTDAVIDGLNRASYPDNGRGGLLLFCGPVGSGLSTSACVTINRMNSVERQVMTIVPQAEYQINGVANVLVRDETGIGDVHQKRRPDVSAAVSAALHGGDVDLLFLGDIIGPQTARAALNAADSGVLVLAVVNASSAHLALHRVADFCGVPPERVADLCRGIVAQRLVRRLNPETRQARETQALELKEWGLPVSHALPSLDTDTALTVYSRCLPTESDKWGDTGDAWKGRLGLFAFVSGTAAWVDKDAGRDDLGREALAKVLSGSITMEDASLAVR